MMLSYEFTYLLKFKLMGKFIIEVDTKVKEVNEKKLKHDFCFSLEGSSFKKVHFPLFLHHVYRLEYLLLKMINREKNGYN